jgi:hypothetical protein
MLVSKTARVQRDFEQLQVKNYPLAALMLDLADFVKAELNKDVVMTMIYRTQEEQWKLYEKTDGAKTTRTSPHMRWEAVDIRDRIYTGPQKKAIGRFLKKYYDETNQFPRLPSGSKTYWLHAIKGQAMHFHIQYKGPLVYVFSTGLEIRPKTVHH